jgi:hypothetical protein
MGNKKVTSTVAAIVMAAALVSLYLTVVGLPPPVDVRPHEALGEAMARETRKLLGADGRILLIGRDTALYPNPAADAQLRAFHRALKKAGASVAATTAIRTDPLRVVSVPSGDFHKLLESASESDVVASFLGPPVLTAGQLAKLGTRRPKVVALCTGEIPKQSDLKRRFDEKLVQTAILSRRDVSPALPASNNPQVWFEHLFVLATEANVAELLATSERK